LAKALLSSVVINASMLPSFAYAAGRLVCPARSALASCLRRSHRSSSGLQLQPSSRLFLGATLGLAVASTVGPAVRPFAGRRAVAMADDSSAIPQPVTDTAALASATATTATGTGAQIADTARKWRLYAIEGSQFVAKAMLALDATDTPYQVMFVNVINRAARVKQLPTDGPLVPQVEIPQVVRGAAGNEQVTYRPLAESTEILQAIDEYHAPALSAGKLYPTSQIRDADTDISDKINAFVLYFNHVSEAGWARSIRSAIVRNLPLGPLNNLIPLRLLYRPVLNSMREKVSKSLPNVELSDAAMTEALISALAPYNESLTGDSATPFLFGYKYPTAADCALHAMVSRFVGTMGDANLPPALPDLFTTAGTRLEKLEKWQIAMAERYPLQWRRYKVDSFPSGKL
jgi:glutathione S-transferase